MTDEKKEVSLQDVYNEVVKLREESARESKYERYLAGATFGGSVVFVGIGFLVTLANRNGTIADGLWFIILGSYVYIRFLRKLGQLKKNPK